MTRRGHYYALLTIVEGVAIAVKIYWRTYSEGRPGFELAGDHTSGSNQRLQRRNYQVYTHSNGTKILGHNVLNVQIVI